MICAGGCQPAPGMPYFDQAGDRTTLKQMTTTLTLKADDLLILLNSMEAEFTDYMSEEELAQHDKMYARLSKALQRLEG